MASQAPPEASELKLRVGHGRRFASARVVVALILREMATTYGRSPMGYLWTIIEPATGIVLLTLVFSALTRTPPLGKSFAIFYATGMVPFLMYSSVSTKIIKSLNFSRSLLVYPSVTYLDAILARFILNGLTQILVAYVVFTGILFMFDTRTVLNLPAIGLGFLMAAILALGIGVTNCFIIGVFPVWERVWTIMNRPMFIISCIFYLWEDVPQPFRDWLWYNPLVHVIGQVRSGFYPYYGADYVSVGYIMGLGLGLTAVGLFFLRRYYRYILNN